MNQSPKTKEIKAKIYKWDYIKLKSLCTAKKTINSTKRKLIEQDKIFANDMTGKRLTTKIHKQLIQLKSASKSQLSL